MTPAPDRGMLGVLPRPTRLEDESHLEFLETFRDMLLTKMFPAVATAGAARMAADGVSEAQTTPLADIQASFGKAAVVPTWQRFMRTQQEMMWRRTRASFGAREADYEAWLTAAETKGPGKLVYDPAFVVPPEYRQEIHLQPGGYTDDPALGGIVYHYGTKVFYQGANDQDELHAELVDKLTPSADGKVARILDIGCTIGQATPFLKERFPQAEVWGLDVGLPVLRYAHARAVERGTDVNFIQALAEDMPFEDGHFDAVLGYILFHEVPLSLIPDILAEVRRVLRPGGTFSIFEFPNQSEGLTPAYRFMIDYDSRDNREPYSVDFVQSDFHGMLRAAGFALEQGPKTSNPFLQSLIATRL
jgi:ubiquinone/menaquinone biosynthesis C-methylase UbiE